MKKEEVCALIKKVGIIPAIRVSSGDDAHFAADAVTQDCRNHHDRARSGGLNLAPCPLPSDDDRGSRHGL
jgi:hypothetical protein